MQVGGFREAAGAVIVFVGATWEAIVGMVVPAESP